MCSHKSITILTLLLYIQFNVTDAWMPTAYTILTAMYQRNNKVKLRVTKFVKLDSSKCNNATVSSLSSECSTTSTFENYKLYFLFEQHHFPYYSLKLYKQI